MSSRTSVLDRAPVQKRRRPPTSVPFTAVDEAISLLDRPSEPWTIEFELVLDGRLDDERFRHAVGDALGRHVMARARQSRARHGDRRPWWEIVSVPDLDPVSVVDASEDDLPAVRDDFQSTPVPLVEAPPLRLRLVHTPATDVVMLNASHTAFDGFGCLRFLYSVARAYAGTTDPPAQVNLAEARRLDRELSEPDSRLKARRMRALRHKASDLLHAPARIAPGNGSDEPGYGLLHISLDAAETAGLSRAPAPATVNDVLLAGLHLAVDRWNSTRGRNTRRISVLLPVNLRPDDWKHDVVTNYVLLSQVWTSAADRRDTTGALRAVTVQTQEIKTATGAALFELVRRLPCLPPLVKRGLAAAFRTLGARLVDTALLTNLARIDDPPWFGTDAGGVVAMWFSAPAQMPCGLSIGAMSLGGRLHLSFRYRHALFDGDAATEFADLYRGILGSMSTAPTRV